MPPDNPLPGPILEATLELWSQAQRRHLFPITGISMLPFLRAGDRVLVSHGLEGIRRGDIVLFRQTDQSLVAHRVMRIRRETAGPTFVTKGDNVPFFDRPVSAGQLVGRVLSVTRPGRSISLDTPLLRGLGWLITMTTLIRLKRYRWSLALKRRLLGPRYNGAPGYPPAGLLADSSRLYRLWQILRRR